MTVHTLSEILRLGRQYDAEGAEVIMSRQACEEAATQLEVLGANKISWRTDDLLRIRELEAGLEAYKLRAQRLFECLENLTNVASIAAIDSGYFRDAVELVSECTALTAVESASQASGIYVQAKHQHVGVVTIDRGETCQVCGKDMYDPIHSQADGGSEHG